METPISELTRRSGRGTSGSGGGGGGAGGGGGGFSLRSRSASSSSRSLMASARSACAVAIFSRRSARSSSIIASLSCSRFTLSSAVACSVSEPMASGGAVLARDRGAAAGGLGGGIMCATPASIADARGDYERAWTRKRGRVTVAAERASVPGTRRVRGGRAREWRATRASVALRVAKDVEKRGNTENVLFRHFSQKKRFFLCDYSVTTFLKCTVTFFVTENLSKVSRRHKPRMRSR